MEKRKREYLFLVSPDPATETNDKFSHYLLQEGLITYGQEMDRIQVEGKTVRGWIVNYSDITQLEKHIRTYPAGAFNADYYEQEDGGQWRLCNLPYLRRKAAKLKQATARLEEIKKGKTEKETP
jgi:hypothetical protein